MHIVLQPKKVNKDLVKALGKFQANILVTSAKVKRMQDAAKRSEGTLDKLMSELHTFHSCCDL